MGPNNFVPDENGNPCGGEGAFPAKIPSADGPLSRRLFIGRIGKIMALGALSHFTLLTGTAHAAGKDKGIGPLEAAGVDIVEQE